MRIKERKTRRLIVVSLDAMGSGDFEWAARMPGFAKVLERAAFCKNVSSIYPSLTYPAHTTIVTGRLPARHGIINNTLLQPERTSPDWYWQRRFIRGTTLYDEAAKAGMTTAALLWPVTGGAGITWNMPEIFANRPWSSQITTSLYNGSKYYQFDLNRRFGHLRNGKAQPDLDHFTQASLLYTLEKYRPDLTLAHLTDLDTQKHHFGNRSIEARDALKRHDGRISQLLAVMDSCGMDTDKDTTLILLGDHSQLDIGRPVLINRLLADSHLLTAEKGRISRWRAICKHCDGSAYIYLNREGLAPDRIRALELQVKHLLTAAADRPGSGIRTLYTGAEAGALGADPDCFMMLEAETGCYFQDVMDEADLTDREKATHGYHPGRKGYETVFMILGPDIRRGYEIPHMTLADEGPVMAALLGLDLGRTDGRIPEGLFM